MNHTRKSTFAMALVALALTAAVAWAQTDAPAGDPGTAKGHHPQALHGPGMKPGGMHGMMGRGEPPNGSCCARCGRGGMRGGGRMGGGPGRMGRGPGRGQGMAMLRALDLTDAQKEKVAEIHERAARKAVQAGADLQLARMDLAKLMRADPPDGRAIDAAIDRIATLRAGIAKTRAGALLEVRGLLTPEQLKKAKDLHGPGMGHMGPRMGFDPDGDDDGPGPGSDGPGDDGIDG